MKYAIVGYLTIALAVFLGLLICRWLKEKKVAGIAMFGDKGGIGEVLFPALLWPVWLLLITTILVSAVIVELVEGMGKK